MYRNIKVIIPIKYVGAVDPGALKTGSRAQHATSNQSPPSPTCPRRYPPG